MVLSYHNILRGEDYGSVIIGDIAALAFVFFIGPKKGIICVVLQLTLISWIPAAIWAAYALSQYNTNKKIAEVTKVTAAADVVIFVTGQEEHDA